ncbi:amino acid ABC transporter permease [Paracoccus laeviglucosivorans]|uniref:Glutamate/aspartate import permease protein GltK n=1 Tax=Paracoccus laeviglucosivorans TaxID=1197861 RepID=A0A521FK49_9RHOB|nr:amino acid ABC transporter permease [Paracoccus laeviglucosivorans]SMO96578.1 amino acid ABC transporter membrane protein, PAAT family [Paracoccus laeviglucosivorans]
MPIFNFDAFVNYLFNSFLIGGVGVTIGLTVAAVIGGLCLGMIIALMRMSGKPLLAFPARFYIWFFRGTPLLIQLVVIYAGLPLFGIKLSVLQSALLGLILNEASYMAEIVRTGFLAVPKGQTEAGWSLNLSRRTIFWRVTLPQAFRLMVPPLGNSINGLLKATSLASVISVEEIMRRSDLLMQEQFQVLEVYAAATIYYLILTSLWDIVQARLESHFGRSVPAAASAKRLGFLRR